MLREALESEVDVPGDCNELVYFTNKQQQEKK